MFWRFFSSLLLLAASWILMVLVDHTPGRLDWPEGLVFLILIYAAWRSVKDLLAWLRYLEGGE